MAENKKTEPKIFRLLQSLNIIYQTNSTICLTCRNLKKKQLNLVPEEEWDAFQKILVQDLPTTFRVSATGDYAPFIYDQLEKFAAELKDIVFEGETIEPPAPIPW